MPPAPCGTAASAAACRQRVASIQATRGTSLAASALGGGGGRVEAVAEAGVRRRFAAPAGEARLQPAQNHDSTVIGKGVQRPTRTPAFASVAPTQALHVRRAL